MVYQCNADGASPTNHQFGSRRRGRWETPSANRTLLPRDKFDLPCDEQSFNSIISSIKDESHELFGWSPEQNRSNFLFPILFTRRVERDHGAYYYYKCTDYSHRIIHRARMYLSTPYFIRSSENSVWISIVVGCQKVTLLLGSV